MLTMSSSLEVCKQILIDSKANPLLEKDEEEDSDRVLEWRFANEKDALCFQILLYLLDRNKTKV